MKRFLKVHLNNLKHCVSPHSSSYSYSSDSAPAPHSRVSVEFAPKPATASEYSLTASLTRVLVSWRGTKPPPASGIVSAITSGLGAGNDRRGSATSPYRSVTPPLLGRCLTSAPRERRISLAETLPRPPEKPDTRRGAREVLLPAGELGNWSLPAISSSDPLESGSGDARGSKG